MSTVLTPHSADVTASRAGSRSRELTGRVWIAFAVFAATFVIWSWTGAGVTTTVGSAVGSLAFLPLNLGAVYWLWRASTSPANHDGERAGLRLLAVMYVCTAIGNLSWAVDELVRHVDPRYSWSNFFYILSYVIGAFALSRFPVAPRGERELKKYLLDAASVLTSIGALVWTFVVAPIQWGAIDRSHLAIELTYPLACIILLGFLLRLIMRQSASQQFSDFAILAIAIFAQCVVDLILELDYRNEVTQLTSWAAAICPGMYVLIIFSAERSARRIQPAPATPPELALNPINLLPTIAGIALYTVLIWAAQSDQRKPLPVLVASALVLNGIFLARQAISVRENAGLLAARAEAESRARYEERAREGQKLEAVGRLAGGIAHDFNNLLTTVLANSEFALSRLRPGDAAFDEVSDIRGAAIRGAELIRQLLAFSRKSVIAPVRLEPDLVLRDMERLLQRLAGERCGLLLELPADLGMVQADRGQLEQVLANLVTNARDAMPDGGAIVITGRNVSLDVAAAAHLSLPAGEYVTLAVQDTGVGIPAEVRGHIFEPFFSTKARGKGTGLGLASTYGIMRQSNGGIEVESEPGLGSCFTLYLPRVPVDVPSRSTGAPVAHDPSVGGRGETILLVEDEAMVRQVTRRMLVAEGYHVLTAPDAVSARVMFDQHGDSIALMITDVMMPGETGTELALDVRRRWPQLAVIFISGYSDAELPDGVGASLVDDFVQKPFTGAQLLARVEARLQAHRSRLPSVAHTR